MTDEEFAELSEVYGKKETEQEPICPDCTEKVLYECVACSSSNYPPKETEQDIAITEKNIALMREQQDIELRLCVKEFFEKYLNRTEESDGGKVFHPITVSCCRVMMMQPLSNLLHEMRELSGAKPKESYD
jgi:hypothetical protein